MQEIDIIILGAREYNYERDNGENYYGTKIYYALNDKMDNSLGYIIKVYDSRRKYLLEELTAKGLSKDNFLNGKLIVGYDFLTESSKVDNITY